MPHKTAKVGDHSSRDVRLGRLINEELERALAATSGQGMPAAVRSAQVADPDSAEVSEARALLALTGVGTAQRLLADLRQSGVLTPTDRPGFMARFGPYEIERVVGAGGMGFVLRAFEPALNRYVALKLLRPEYGMRDDTRLRFRREAQAAAAIHHPNVITIHAVGEHNGADFLAMEYVAGPTLAGMFSEEPTMPRSDPGAPGPCSATKGSAGILPANVGRAVPANPGRATPAPSTPPRPWWARWPRRRTAPPPASVGLPTALVRALFEQLLAGLSAAHAKGLVHRDIKPANLLLDFPTTVADAGVPPALDPSIPGATVGDDRSLPHGRGSDEHASLRHGGAPRQLCDDPTHDNCGQDARTPPMRGRDARTTLRRGAGSRRAGIASCLSASLPTLKITDFGLVRSSSFQTLLTLERSQLGTPAYMSPEQVRESHDVDHRSDLYSAGVVLFEMLTGHRPFPQTDPVSAMHELLHADPPDPRRLNPVADPHLSAIALKLMSKPPADRFQSATETLAAVQGGRRVHSPATRRRRNGRLLAGVALLSLAGVIGVAMYQIARRTPSMSTAGAPEPRGGELLRFTNVTLSPEHGPGSLIFNLNNHGAKYEYRPSDLGIGPAARTSEADKFVCAVPFTGTDLRSYMAVSTFQPDEEGNTLFILRAPTQRGHLPEAPAVDVAPEPGSIFDRPKDSWPNCSGIDFWRTGNITPLLDRNQPVRELFLTVMGSGVSDCWVSFVLRVHVDDPAWPKVSSQRFLNTGGVNHIWIWPNYFPDRLRGQRHALLCAGSNNKLDGWGLGDGNGDEPGPDYPDPASRYVDYAQVKAMFILDPENMAGISPPGGPDIDALGMDPKYQLQVPPAHYEAYAMLNTPSAHPVNLATYVPRRAGEPVWVIPEELLDPILESTLILPGDRPVDARAQFQIQLPATGRRDTAIGAWFIVDKSLNLKAAEANSQCKSAAEPRCEGFMKDVESRWHTVYWNVDGKTLRFEPPGIRNLCEERQRQGQPPAR